MNVFIVFSVVRLAAGSLSCGDSVCEDDTVMLQTRSRVDQGAPTVSIELTQQEFDDGNIEFATYNGKPDPNAPSFLDGGGFDWSINSGTGGAFGITKENWLKYSTHDWNSDWKVVLHFELVDETKLGGEKFYFAFDMSKVKQRGEKNCELPMGPSAARIGIESDTSLDDMRPLPKNERMYYEFNYDPTDRRVHFKLYNYNGNTLRYEARSDWQYTFEESKDVPLSIYFNGAKQVRIHSMTMEADGVIGGTPAVAAGNGNANAAGDPHLRNVRGEKFDVHTTGSLRMVTIPHAASVEDSDLSIIADVAPATGQSKPCPATFIHSVHITGSWLGTTSPIHINADDMKGMPQLVGGVPDMGSRKEKVAWGNATVEFDRGHPNRRNSPHVSVEVGPVKATFSQRALRGFAYLDMEVKGLNGFDSKGGVGGLLGFDDHSAESMPSPGCSQPRFSGAVLLNAMSDARLLSSAVAW